MKWQVEINDFNGGYAPNWYRGGTYPSFGNRNQAGAMANVDLSNYSYLLPGPAVVSPASDVTTLVKGILNFFASDGFSYGVGGAKLYQINSNAVVTSDATWPHTIDKATVTAESGEDVVLFQGNLYYSYNHSGSAGDIGKFDLSSTFDDDWGSTVPTGAAALGGDPHPMDLGGNDTFAVGNGRYLATYDGTTFAPQALDLPTGWVIVDVKWKSDRWWITANYPNSTVGKNLASIFIWDGSATSWETEIKLPGKAAASYIKDDVFYQFYEDATDNVSSVSGSGRLGYFNGSKIQRVTSFSTSLPNYYQVTDFRDFIMWVGNNSNEVFMWGPTNEEITKIFQYASGSKSWCGGIAALSSYTFFTTQNTGSTEYAENYWYNIGGTYATVASWKSLLFDITGGKNSRINEVRINFEKLASGARVDWSLVNNKAVTIYSDIISFAKLGAKTTAYYPLNGKLAENFRVELNFANGSSTAPVKIKSIKIYGTTD